VLLAERVPAYLVELKVNRTKVLNFVDPAQYAASIRSADIEIFPTAKGEFRSQLTQVTLDRLWMQRFEETLPRIHRGRVTATRKVFTFLTEDQPEVYNRGRLFSLGDLCAHDHDMQHVVTTGKYRLGGVSLAVKEIAEACSSMMGFEFDPQQRTRFLRPAPDLMKRFLDLHAIAGAFAKTAPELLEVPEVIRAIEHQLVYALLRCVADCNVSAPKDGRLRHGTIVARFEDFIDANPNTPLYLDEICSAIGVAERTLRVVCEEHLGMGPIRYLTLRRMHLVHRALGQAAPDCATVTQIATTHGFWELGRFSVAYRNLFGEPPLATLRRREDFRSRNIDRPSQLVS
jgi:AraC-like DNA-binding protein